MEQWDPHRASAFFWEHAWHSRCASVCPNRASAAEAARKREVMSKSLLSCGNPVFSTGNPGQGHKPRGAHQDQTHQGLPETYRLPLLARVCPGSGPGSEGLVGFSHHTRNYETWQTMGG